jgi:hypothetical protein
LIIYSQVVFGKGHFNVVVIPLIVVIKLHFFEDAENFRRFFLTGQWIWWTNMILKPQRILHKIKGVLVFFFRRQKQIYLPRKSFGLVLGLGFEFLRNLGSW